LGDVAGDDAIGHRHDCRIIVENAAAQSNRARAYRVGAAHGLVVRDDAPRHGQT
jgi:hypothetical protein